MDRPTRVLSIDLLRGADVWTGRNPYEALGGSLVAGTLRSVVFAWAIVRLSGWMRARGLRLQL